MGNFEASYAGAYDSLYESKDYGSECDLIERVWGRFSRGGVHDVLDLGCGTGSHALELASRGYDVVGVDRSEPMIELARSKSAENATGKLTFERADVRTLDLAKKFDAAVMMFAVLGYQTENDDLRSALASIRRHLDPGGLLTFDCWYGPAVLRQGPEQRVRVVGDGVERVVRFASGTLDPERGVCQVDYRLWQLSGDRLVSETEERHAMRYFFKPELELLLSSCGFDLLHLGCLPDIDEAPSDSSWNVLGVAKAESEA